MLVLDCACAALVTHKPITAAENRDSASGHLQLQWLALFGGTIHGQKPETVPNIQLSSIVWKHASVA